MLSTLLPYNNSDRQSSIVAILHPFGIIPTESFKVKQSSRFEKFIWEKKMKWITSKGNWGSLNSIGLRVRYSTILSLPAPHLIKWIKRRYMSNGSEQELLYCSRVNELKTAVPSQRITKKTTEYFFFPVLFWDGWVCYYKTHSPCIRKVTHDKAIIELFQGEIWWPL